MLGHGTDDARGYRQLQEAGRTVKKGAKSFYILGPNTRKVRKTNEESCEEVERLVVTGLRGVRVFRYEDTEGDPVERPDYAPFVGEDQGVYLPKSRRIRLYSTSARVFFHELAHAAAREADGERKPGSMGKADEEVAAETVAGVLCVLYGFEHELAASRRYIEEQSTAYEAEDGYERAARGVGKVLRRVEKTLDLIDLILGMASSDKLP